MVVGFTIGGHNSWNELVLSGAKRTPLMLSRSTGMPFKPDNQELVNLAHLQLILPPAPPGPFFYAMITYNTPGNSQNGRCKDITFEHKSCGRLCNCFRPFSQPLNKADFM